MAVLPYSGGGRPEISVDARDALWSDQGGLIRRVIDRVDEEGTWASRRLHIAWGVRQLRREGDPPPGDVQP